MLDELGGPATYNHYPTGWAMAFNTPFKMWKRYSFNGGTCDPCIVSWPAGIAARGEIRHQYHHAIDLVPTVLECLGLAQPAAVRGVTQIPIQGVSMMSSFTAADAPSTRTTQFFSMLGTRGIWHDGWKAVTTHPAHRRVGQLRAGHLGALPRRHRPVRAARPRRGGARAARRTVGLWFYEAGANHAFPLDDRSALEIILTPRPQLVAPRERYVYRPGGAEIPEFVAVNVRNRSFTIGADVDLPTPRRPGGALRPRQPVRRATRST